MPSCTPLTAIFSSTPAGIGVEDLAQEKYDYPAGHGPWTNNLPGPQEQTPNVENHTAQDMQVIGPVQLLKQLVKNMPFIHWATVKTKVIVYFLIPLTQLQVRALKFLPWNPHIRKAAEKQCVTYIWLGKERKWSTIHYWNQRALLTWFGFGKTSSHDGSRVTLRGSWRKPWRRGGGGHTLLGGGRVVGQQKRWCCGVKVCKSSIAIADISSLS